MNPKAWWDDLDTVPKNTKPGYKIPSPDEPLVPFSKDTEGTKWTSNTVRDWTVMGYQYDVLERRGKETDEAYIERIKADIDSKYKDAGKVVAEAVQETPALLLPPQEQPTPGLPLPKPDFEALSRDITVNVNAASNKYPDYLLDIIYDR